MPKLFIFNHKADEWIHPWNELQINYFKEAGYDVVEKRTNGVNGNDIELAKELEGNIVLCNWADTILIGLSCLKAYKDFRLVTYIRSYEIASNFVDFIHWKYVDNVIMINPWKYKLIMDYGQKRFKNFDMKKIHYIRNPFEWYKYPFKIRKEGYRLGAPIKISVKKGVGILYEFVVAMQQVNPNFQLNILGGLGDGRGSNYLKYMQEKTEYLESPRFNVYKFTKNRDTVIEFLDTLDFVISTSIDEGDPNFINEAMSMGIKPVMHAFPGAYEIFPNELVANSVGQMFDIMFDGKYESEKYRDWVKEHNDPPTIMKAVKQVVEG